MTLLHSQNALRSQSDIEPRSITTRSMTRGGFHRIACLDWGDNSDETPIVCVHGLTRNAHDFDFLARALVRAGRRVVCPDLPGRGASDRLPSQSDYALPQYCRDMGHVLSRIGTDEIDWVGTSLGGLIGIVMASMQDTPIRRLVINDIGPYIPWSGLVRLGVEISQAPRSFATMEDAVSWYRRSLAPFGALTDAQWYHLVRHSVRRNEERDRFELIFDPAIAAAFRNPWHYALDLWKAWDAIKIPILLLRGEQSDLLTEATARDMLRRNKNARLERIPDCGHAPALMDEKQIDLVRAFLQD